MASSVSGGGPLPQTISVVVSSAPAPPAVGAEGSRRRVSQIRLVGVDGVERQNYCCGHWFPTSKSYQRHLMEQADGGDESHELRLVELGLVRCLRCPAWIPHDAMSSHLRKAHGIVKVAKTTRSPLVQAPATSTQEATPNNSYVIKVSGSSSQAKSGEVSGPVRGDSSTKPSTVKLVTTSGKLYHKLHPLKPGSSSSSSVVVRQGDSSTYPVVSMGPRIVMKSVPGGGIINLGTVAGARKLLPGCGSGPHTTTSTFNGIGTVHLSTPKTIRTQAPTASKTVVLQNKVASVNGQNVKKIANIKTKKVTALVPKVLSAEGSCAGTEVSKAPVLVVGDKQKEKSKTAVGSEATPARPQQGKKSRKQVLSTSLPDLTISEGEGVTPSPYQKVGKKAKQSMPRESRFSSGSAEPGRSPAFTPKGHRRKSSYLMEGESLFIPGKRSGKKKKKRKPGRPRKELSDESSNMSDIESLFNEDEDLENEPIVRPKKGRKVEKAEEVEREDTGEAEVPTVELDLFTLPSLNEQVSVLLTEPKNPNFKVYASMDAIFVGDSALGDVTNQLGYVTDANSVVYVNPSHFLFPNVNDLENFVPAPILTMKGSKTSSIRQWKLNTAGNKPAASSPAQTPLKEVANNSVLKEMKKCGNNPVERLTGDENSTPVVPHKKKQSPKVRQKESLSPTKSEPVKSMVEKVNVVGSQVHKSTLSSQTTMDNSMKMYNRTPKKKRLSESTTEKEESVVVDGNSDSSSVTSVSEDAPVVSKSPIKTVDEEKTTLSDDCVLRKEENVDKPVTSPSKLLCLKKVRVPLKKLKILTKKGKNMTLKVDVKPLNIKPTTTKVQSLLQKDKNLPKKGKDVIPEIEKAMTEPEKVEDLSKKTNVKVLSAKDKNMGKKVKIVSKGTKKAAVKGELKAVEPEQEEKSELQEKIYSPKAAARRSPSNQLQDIAEGPVKDVSKVVENLQEVRNRRSKSKKVKDIVASQTATISQDSVLGSPKVAPQKTEPINGTARSPSPKKKILISVMPAVSDSVGSKCEDGQVVPDKEQGRDSDQAQGGRGGNSRLGRRRNRLRTKSAEDAQGENSYKSRRKMRQLSESSVFLKELENLEKDISSLAEMRQRLGCEPVSHHSVVVDQGGSDSAVHIGQKQVEQSIYSITPTSRSPSTDSEATLSASSREGVTCPSEPSTDSEATLSACSSTREGDTIAIGEETINPEVLGVEQETFAEKTPAKRASKRKLRKEQAEPLKAVKVDGCVPVVADALPVPAEATNSPELKQVEVVRPVRDRRPSFKLVENVALANPSPKRSSSSIVRAESEVTRSPVKADSGVIKTPVKADSGVIQTPVKADSGVIKTPVKADSGVTRTPVKADSGVTRTPVKADSGVMKTPVKADSGVTRTPAKADSGVTRTPIKADSGVTKTPVKADSGVMKTPVKADFGVTRTPVKADSRVSKVIKTPGKVDSGVTKSLTKADSGVVTKTPAKVESGVTKSPVKADSGVVTKTPAKVDSVVTNAPVMADSGVTKNPTKADSGVAKTPSKTKSVVMKTPAKAEPGDNETCTKGDLVTPAMAESGDTESATPRLSCVSINTLLAPNAGRGEDASPTEEPREWHGRGAKLKAKVLIQDQQTGVTDSQVPTSLTSTLAHVPPAKGLTTNMHSPSSKSPTTSPREWQARGAKLKAQVRISDPEGSVVPYTSPHSDQSITTPPPKKLKTDNSPGMRDIRSFFTVTKSPVQQEGAARSPGQQQATGKSPGMQQAAGKSAAQQQAVDTVQGQQQPEEDISPHGKMYSKAFGPPASMASRKRMRRHSHTRADIRSYFAPAAVAKRKLLSAETTVDSESKVLEMAIPPSLLIPPAGGSTLILGSMKQEAKRLAGPSEPMPEAVCDFEGFERCSRRSGIRAKNLLRHVSLIEMKRWYNLGKLPFPLDQLCDWDDELLTSLIFDQIK